MEFFSNFPKVSYANTYPQIKKKKIKKITHLSDIGYHLQGLFLLCVYVMSHSVLLFC